MKIKKNCNNCNYYSEGKRNVRLFTWDTNKEITLTLENALFNEKELPKPFDRYDITIDPCPLVSWCPSKTAPCSIMPPDDGCYWYRYFKELIKNKES